MYHIFNFTADAASDGAEITSRRHTATQEFDWEPVMEAIIWHESKGNPVPVAAFMWV